jgi:hypothetical protein
MGDFDLGGCVVVAQRDFSSTRDCVSGDVVTAVRGPERTPVALWWVVASFLFDRVARRDFRSAFKDDDECAGEGGGSLLGRDDCSLASRASSRSWRAVVAVTLLSLLHSATTVVAAPSCRPFAECRRRDFGGFVPPPPPVGVAALVRLPSGVLPPEPAAGGGGGDAAAAPPGFSFAVPEAPLGTVASAAAATAGAIVLDLSAFCSSSEACFRALVRRACSSQCHAATPI